MDIILITSIILNFFFLVLLIIFIKRGIIIRDSHYSDYNKWVKILIKMKEIDNKQYFQEDDQVGHIFKDLKQLLYEAEYGNNKRIKNPGIKKTDSENQG